MALPTITGVARLVADPEIRMTSGGVAVCSMRLAFNSRKKDESGNWVDGDVFYVKATAWRQLAENAGESLAKGSEVLVSGELRTESWEADGGKREAPALLIRSIGPNLAWATARVSKASDGSNGRASTPASQQAQRGRQAPAHDPWATGGNTGYSNEPPF